MRTVLIMLSFLLASCTPRDQLTLDRADRIAEGITAATTWRCDTPGGEVSAALLLGYAINDRGASTEIRRDDVCGSAGALVFLAGRQRTVHAGGRLIFHGPTGMNDAERHLLPHALRRWGVPPELARRVLELRPGQIWEPSREDLR